MNFVLKEKGDLYVSGFSNAQTESENGISSHSSFEFPSAFFFEGSIISYPKIVKFNLISPVTKLAKVVDCENGLRLWYDEAPKPPFKVKVLNKDVVVLNTINF